jgi:hypothetical protein
MRSFQDKSDAGALVDASYREASGTQGVCWRPTPSGSSKRFGRDAHVAALRR